MSESGSLLYEVTLSIEQDRALDLDQWLESHVSAMLDVPGIVDATTFRLDDENGRVRRVTHYRFADDEHLERYLAGPAKQLRQATQDKFGEHVTATRRVLHGSPPSDSLELERCLNCDAALSGQYCGNCGQRSTHRLISLLELIKDAVGDLFELDSRLWRTLIPLAIRPGKLTHDYLRGRRARYMPPFRMYIVLSLAFFLVAFFDPRDDLGILFEALPDTALDAASNGATPADPQESAPANVGLDITFDDDGTDGGDGISTRCELNDYDASQVPPWIARRFTKERLSAACLRIVDSEGPGLRTFLDNLADNVPVGLFILLPLMALALKVLYPLSRRYYVEHLLFVIHFHSFIFLALFAQVAFARITPEKPLPDSLSGLFSFALFIYVPVYFFKALRRVYGQGRLSTFLKFATLLVAYATGLSLILVVAALFAAFSA